MKALLWLCVAAGSIAACGPTGHSSGDDGGDDTPGIDAGSDSGTEHCPKRCSEDLDEVLDCNNNVVETCDATEACDGSTNVCANACEAAENNHRSIGCSYHAVHMDTLQPGYCFAVFITNTWTTPAKISVTYDDNNPNTSDSLAVENFARIPVGSGPGLTYMPYDRSTGIRPGEVAVLFLSGQSSSLVPCPVPAAVPGAARSGTGLSSSFHITTDVPVVAYQMNPYGGGRAAVTAASLLVPTSAWDTDYVAVNVSPMSSGKPSMNIIAREDGTVATITPVATITGGGGISPGVTNQPMAITLKKGQHAQITQDAELTGSVIKANKPIGFMAGQTCMNMPSGASFCDHGEQMVPPTRALAHRYVGVMYRPRVPAESATFWRIVGAVDGTQLTWSTNVGGPTTLNKGQSVVFETGTPFVVSSQDRDHPFMLFTYMTGSTHVQAGYGDPDFVFTVPPAQFMKRYVFFTDPTYPETNLVLVRARGADQQFHAVTLDCLGDVAGWYPVGDYEYARVDLMTRNFERVGNCSTGRREIRSSAPFGLWVWGWGTPLTSTFTREVSYGYPAGMNVSQINDVVIF